MRALLALALTLSALALSGCTAEGSGALFSSSPQDCSTATDEAVARSADVLLPHQVPSASRPQVKVTVREGQVLVANAVWRPTVGNAQVVFDGPSQHQVQVGTTWSSSTQSAPAGEYTLSLEGAPMAQGVSYTLMLVAAGCTPA